jgi:hypothetical protein
MTSGILVGHGIHSLNNPMLLERIESRQQEMVNCQIAQGGKKCRKGRAQIGKVAAIRQEKGHSEENQFKNWDT